ncbi:DNA-directed RNA polymerase subunit omega [Candidatus Kuenenia sp.]|uniref:DNA-directed RNA polymerase subunit omega n=1 Tax=Candidatus Kuenenia sp. TaxID=2499824 RepID=UPI00321F749B
MNYKSLDTLINQVGGPLRLTSLIISRARQLTKKAAPYIETEIDDPVEIAFTELMQNKIMLNDEAKK